MKEIVERLARHNARGLWGNLTDAVKEIRRDQARRQIGIVLDALAGTVIGSTEWTAIADVVLAAQRGGKINLNAINRIACHIIDLWRDILANDGEMPKQEPLSEVGRYMKSAAEEILNGNPMPPVRVGTPQHMMEAMGLGFGPAPDATPAPPLGNGTFVNTTIANAPAEKQWSVLDDPGAVPPVPLHAAPPAPAAEAKPPNQGCANCQWSEYTQIEPGQIGRSPHPLYCTWTKNFWPSPLPWEPRIFMRPDDGFMCSTWKRRGTDV